MVFTPVSRRWSRRLPALALGAWLAAAGAAHAQPAAPRPPRADPLDAQAAVPAATHRSALAGYRRLGEDTRIPWQDANTTVNRIGGWRAYTREAQAPEAPASAPASPAHHGHHGTHGGRR